MRRKYSLVLFAAIVAFAVGCGEEDSNNPPSTPVITTSSASVGINQQVNLIALAMDPDGDAITYLWQATGGSFSITSGESVVWTSPTVEGTYTITVDAKDSHGASSSSSINSVNIFVSAQGGTGGNGNTESDVNCREIEVIIGMNDGSIWPPFLAGFRGYGRTQFLYYAGEIGMSGKIKQISVMPCTVYQKTYTSVKVSMLMVNRNEIASDASENYEGGNPVVVYSSPSVIYGGNAVWKNWHNLILSTPFDYDGVSNLLIEFEMSGDQGDPGSVGTCSFATNPGQQNRYMEMKDRGQEVSIPHPGAVYLRMILEVQ